MNKKIKHGLSLAIAIVVIGLFVYNNKSQSISSEPIKIGAILPLTGDVASYGQAGMAGIDAAVKEINNVGGINGRKIEIIYEDDKCDVKEGASAANKLVNIDKVSVIVGGICSGVVSAEIPIIEMSKTPMIITGASRPDLTKNNDFIFRIYPSDNFQGEFAAKYVINQMNKNKVAVIYEKNGWSQGLYDVFTATFSKLGSDILFEDSVAPNSLDFKAILAKVKIIDPEVIYAPLNPKELIAFLKQAKEFGLKGKIIGGDMAETDEVKQSGYAEGLLYTIGIINNPENFKQKINTLTGKDSNFMTVTAYDSVNILATIIKKVGTNNLKIKESLGKLDYKGVSSEKISFDSEGDIKDVAFEIRVIRDKTSVKY